ncbi:MAG TPA: hypothetical protein VFX87_03130 [Methylomirabilota bacterium]|nr:hypothetical protein [Methylomirabilota bacterium]
MSPGSRLLPAAALLTLTAAGTGCEYFRDTPEQELANRRWRQCTAELRDVKLDRVDTDGRIRFTYVTMNERDRALECLEAAGRQGPRLPEPVPAAAAGK